MSGSKGFRAGTRDRLKKDRREKFKPEDYIKGLKPGDRVMLSPEPASHKGMPHPRFKGRVGKVVDRRGRAYLVKIKDQDKTKKLTVRPEHLKKVKKA